MSYYNLARMNVVVVDDSNYMLNVMKMLLAAMDIRNVRCHRSVKPALDDIGDSRPHLVITDLLMDGDDGLELTQQIRCEEPPICFTPIFILSGYTDKRHVLLARDVGAHEVLAKPIAIQTLYDRIIGLIEDHRPFVRTGRYFGPERRRIALTYEGANQRHDYSGVTARVQQASGPGDAFYVDDPNCGPAKR